MADDTNEGYIFDAAGARRIAAAVREVERQISGLKANLGALKPALPQRWFQVLNDEGADIPGYAIVAITDLHSASDRAWLPKVKKTSSTTHLQYAVVSP